jgi:hypothetical protein
LKQRSGQLCGEQLKRESDPIHDQGGDRDHQNQKRPRKEDSAKERPSLEQNDQACQQNQERQARKKNVRAQHSQNQHKHAQ